MAAICVIAIAALGLVGPAPHSTRHAPAPVGAVALERRALLSRVAAASAAALVATTSLAPAGPARAAVVAPIRDEAELKEAVVLIVRVMEATEQEERLINSGKYKDLQRKSVKNAAVLLLENYALPTNLVRAAIFVPQESVAEAARLGQEATEALNQIVGYFPAELSVGELERPQREFVLKALSATRTNLAAFIALLPPAVVKAAVAQVETENKLNAADYYKIFGEPMLNVPGKEAAAAPNPAAKAAPAKKGKTGARA